MCCDVRDTNESGGVSLNAMGLFKTLSDLEKNPDTIMMLLN